MPRLTKNELKLVEVRDEKYLKIFTESNPDVDNEEMEKSNSKDKYVKAECRRWTEYLTTDSTENPFQDEISVTQIEGIEIQPSQATVSFSIQFHL